MPAPAFTQRRIRDPIRRQQRHVISLNSGVGRRQRTSMSGVFQRRPAAAGGTVHIGARQIPRRRLQQLLRFCRFRLRLHILPGIRQRHHIATLQTAVGGSELQRRTPQAQRWLPLLQVAIGAGHRRQTGAIPLQRSAVGTPKRDHLFIVAGPAGHRYNRLAAAGSTLLSAPL